VVVYPTLWVCFSGILILGGHKSHNFWLWIRYLIVELHCRYGVNVWGPVLYGCQREQ
jgi:hypothetical protein